jgi:hypothetical protein
MTSSAGGPRRPPLFPTLSRTTTPTKQQTTQGQGPIEQLQVVSNKASKQIRFDLIWLGLTCGVTQLGTEHRRRACPLIPFPPENYELPHTHTHTHTTYSGAHLAYWRRVWAALIWRRLSTTWRPGHADARVPLLDERSGCFVPSAASYACPVRWTRAPGEKKGGTGLPRVCVYACRWCAKALKLFVGMAARGRERRDVAVRYKEKKHHKRF